MDNLVSTINEQQLESLLEREKEPLYTLSTIFPFVIFPTNILIYRNKVIIEKNIMFISKYEFPILIEDMKTITVSTNLWFASLLFEIKGFEPNPSLVSFLHTSEALEARKIIMGLMMLKRKKISTENISGQDLVENVKQIG